MKNIILAIDRVEPGLVAACKKLEIKLGYKLQGLRLVSSEYKNMSDTTYAPDESGFFNEVLVDYNDTAQLQQIFKDIKQNILVVNCRDESSMNAFAKVIPFIPNVPTPNESTLKWATQKNYMRDMMASYDSSMVPRYIEIPRDKLHSYQETLLSFHFPVIVKPCGLNTSMLVQKCDSMTELQNVMQKTYSVIDEIYAQQQGNGEPTILVEEFIVGDMYSIDAYVSTDGLDAVCLPPVRVITANEVGLNGFYGYERILPCNLSAADIAEAERVTKNAIKAVNLRSCTAHVELYKTETGWKIIELGPRIGGNRERLYKLSYDIDHYYNDLASRIAGLEIEINPEPIATAICINLYPEHDGVIKSFVGIEEAKNLSTTVYVRELLHIGDFAKTAENGGLYYADAVFAGKDAAQVREDAKKAHEMIRIEIEE